MQEEIFSKKILCSNLLMI